MTFLESWTMFFIMTAIYVVGRYLDIMSSQNFPNYGLTEGFKFSMNKIDGSFNTTKNVIGSAFFLGAALAIEIVAKMNGTGGGWALLIFLGIMSYYHAYHNVATKKENRGYQTRQLTRLKNGEAVNLGQIETWKASGHRYFTRFPFVYVTDPIDTPDEVAAVQAKLVGMMTELANRPESEWFPKDE